MLTDSPMIQEDRIIAKQDLVISSQKKARFCTSCGFEFGDIDRFCGGCGEKRL